MGEIWRGREEMRSEGDKEGGEGNMKKRGEGDMERF